jgi:hypothetical protein
LRTLFQEQFGGLPQLGQSFFHGVAPVLLLLLLEEEVEVEELVAMTRRGCQWG